MNSTEVLRHLALIPQDVPDVVAAGESLQKVYYRHFPAEDGGLALTAELTVEERGYVETITAAMTDPNSQAFFDPTRLLAVVAFFAKHPELFAAIAGLFKKA